MKIRTIIGVLLVLALVLGSTGAAFAASGDGNEDGANQNRYENKYRHYDGSCQVDGITLANQNCNRDCNCDEECVPIGDGPYYGPH